MPQIQNNLRRQELFLSLVRMTEKALLLNTDVMNMCQSYLNKQQLREAAKYNFVFHLV